MESNINYDNSQEALDAKIRASSLRAKEVYDTLTEDEIAFVRRYDENDLIRKFLTAEQKLIVKSLLAKGAVTKEKFYRYADKDNGSVCYQFLCGLETHIDYLDGTPYKQLVELFGEIE